MVSRLIAYHTERLKDKNPTVRLNAINELRLLGEVSAMAALEQVFRNDEDAEVRKAAQEAGREIFIKNQPKKAE